MTLDTCRLVELKTVSDHRGKLTCMEAGAPLPFDIKRMYYLYGVPAGAARGGHAHHALEQFMIAVSGQCDITLDDGVNKRTYTLNSRSAGLLIGKGIWREMANFSADAVVVVLASAVYDESDYVRSYEDFIAAKTKSAP